MNQQSIQTALSSLPIGDVRYYDSIGSTNDDALAWAKSGAPDLSIVLADEQTAGRGRLNRKWMTPKGSALAFSLILRPPSRTHLSRTVGLAALSAADSCQMRGLSPQIKWPNDILLNGKKAAGILLESVWSGSEVNYVIIGIGINVLKESTPPAETLKFPAISVEEALGAPVDRLELFADILTSLIKRRAEINTSNFLNQWEQLLAFRGQFVHIINNDQLINSGVLRGLNADGSLQLINSEDKIVSIQFGDVSLRPAV